MKPYILKYKEFLKYFSKLPQKGRIRVIPHLNRGHINAISEICQNFLKENLTKCSKVIRKLKPSKKQIKALALKKTSLRKKKQILQSRAGGGILSVLLPIATSLIGSLIGRR